MTVEALHRGGFRCRLLLWPRRHLAASGWHRDVSEAALLTPTEQIFVLRVAIVVSDVMQALPKQLWYVAAHCSFEYEMWTAQVGTPGICTAAYSLPAGSQHCHLIGRGMPWRSRRK